MIEQFLKEELEQRITEPVVLQVTSGLPSRFIVLEKTGSSMKNHLPRSQIAVQSYAESLYEAAKLNECVKQALQELEANPRIVRMILNSDYNFTDTETKQFRYQAVYDVIHY